MTQKNITITHYEFGKIVINKQIYTSDIKIIKCKIIPNWWRKEGHKLCIQDIKDVLEAKPKKIIIGCGANSVMNVLDEVKTYCAENNIELFILNTYDAVDRYNKLSNEQQYETSLCLHLTC
ncbi:MAG: MTH938/NDUFAF3 family protein [Endomicrobia bacterium]|nr:MTH938/NDUFAF3 family protein [Endomicrobiia bacterium]